MYSGNLHKNIVVGISYMVIIMSSVFIFGYYDPNSFLNQCSQILFLITVSPLSLCYDVAL